MVESLTAKLHVVVSKTAPSSFVETCVLMGLCVREKKAEGLGWTEELQLQRARWNTVLYSSTLSVGENTHQRIGEQVLKSCWPGRSALHCDAG